MGPRFSAVCKDRHANDKLSCISNEEQNHSVIVVNPLYEESNNTNMSKQFTKANTLVPKNDGAFSIYGHNHPVFPEEKFLMSMKRRFTELVDRLLTRRGTRTLRQSCSEDLSISGIKVVCSHPVHFLRRFLWTALLVSMLALLIITAVHRGCFYQATPTNVNTQTIFNNRIQFPSVTVCNMNMLRTSATYRLLQQDIFPQRRDNISIYEAVTEYFGVVENWSEEGANEYRDQYKEIWSKCYSDSNCDNLYRAAGHAKESFIVGCSWRGRECGPDNFTEVYTDLGLCYMWNSGLGDSYIHHVESAGLNGGLQLDLNMEQYEYMRSTKEVAGAYAVIQDQNDSIDMVDGRGFPISIGTFVTTALSKTVYTEIKKSVESNCRDGKSYARCILNCFTAYLGSQCLCKDYFMPGNMRICTVEDHLSCFFPKKVEFPSLSNYTDYCGFCKPACNRTKYDMSVTTSPLSDFFAKRKAHALKEDRKLKSNYEEVNRIINWVLLYQARKIYAYGIYEMTLSYSQVYYILTSLYKEPLLVFNRTVNDLVLDRFPLVNSSDIETLKLHLVELSELYKDVSSFIQYHFLFNYMENTDRLSEDINVRIATDMFRKENKTFKFVEYASEQVSKIKEQLYKLRLIWTKIDEHCRDKFHSSSDSSTNINQSEWVTPVISATVHSNGTTQNDSLSCSLISRMMNSSLEVLLTGVINGTNNLGAILRSHVILERAIAQDPKLVDIPRTDGDERIDEGFYMRNFARVQIYFKEMAYHTVSQYESYDSSALISDLGGSLGFYLGGSCLTLMEIADILFIKCFAKKIQNGSKEKQGNNKI